MNPFAKLSLAAFIELAAVAQLSFAAPARAPVPLPELAHLKQDTRILSSDAFEGRAPMTRGERAATSYIAAAMRKIGLRPGAGDSYFQHVPMVQSETLREPAPRFSVAGSSGTLGFIYQHDVTLNSVKAKQAVDLDGLDVVFVGYGIHAPDRDWDDYAGIDVRGKTVLILVNDPDWRSPNVGGRFGGKAMTYYGRWDYKFEEAARQGAAAAIVIHSDAAAGYPFSVPASSLGARTTRLASDDGGARFEVESWMTRPAAEKLFAAAGQNLDRLEEAAGQPGFRAQSLDLHASFHFKSRTSTGQSTNVIGVLPGRTRPGEYVIYTAHWDHLGHCPADATGDSVCNGAIDNASGVAGLLELARMFKRQPRLDRSIIFLATTGEEQGLLGSHFYAEHPLYPLASTVAEIDLDPLSFMFGATRDISLVADQTDLAAVVRRAAAAQHRVVTPDSSPEQGNRYRSDTLSFSRAGVPVVLLGNGVDVIGKPAGWGQRALDDYSAHRYHQPSDSYDPHWDWSGATQDLQLYYLVGHELAARNSWPNWFSNDEFRAARDAVLKRRPDPRTRN